MRHHSRWGRAITLALGLLLVVAASPVQAGKSQHFTDHTVGIDCEGDSASASFFTDVFSSEIDGLHGDLDIWVSPSVPFDDPADYHRDYDQPLTGTVTATGATVTFAMVDRTGAPAPSATVTATFTPAGPAEPFSDRFKDGNQWQRQEGTDTPLAVTASVAVPGITLPTPECGGFAETLSFFATDPHSVVRRDAERFISCPLEDGAGNTGRLNLNVEDDPTLVFVDASLDLPNDAFREAFGELPIVDQGVDGVLPVYDSATDSLLPDPATLVAQIARKGEDASYTFVGGTGRVVNHVTRYAVTGTLTFPGGPAFDLDGCFFQVRLSKELSNVPSSKLKTGGKVPANDTPSGAEVLKVPGTASAQTGGAHDAEVPIGCVLAEEDQPIDAFRTVWYRITGTGGTVTVDTAGSKFDTVLEVYTASGGSFTPVPDTCIDDVALDPVGRTLQAAVSWPTTAGVTYYVQIGGFPEDLNWGSLKVRAR